MTQAKIIAVLIAVIALLLALLGGGWYAYHSGYAQGAASVQSKWDSANALASAAATKAVTQNAATEQAQASSLDVIESNFIKANDHALPSLAAGLPASVAAGTLQLRDTATCSPSGGAVSATTASSRAADAAATQALADRVANSIAAVRAGDAADKREQQLDNQVVALQAALTAERAK